MTKFTFTEKKDTRSGFGVGLHELGKKNSDVVALCADLTGSLKMDAFKKEFPDRFFQVMRSCISKLFQVFIRAFQLNYFFLQLYLQVFQLCIIGKVYNHLAIQFCSAHGIVNIQTILVIMYVPGISYAGVISFYNF